ncbi:hypothetical protein FEA48_11045 [Pseudomonas nitroreducens]|uniref:HK97 gp10 family phage protein n=1 Tax=Pseudomonas nitroreducens TaxID=46680 RepID=A0A5R9A7S5_PSENT|nr:hypothetical protein [Pseudomonas nitroreducens]TLP74743.1 hypothetical protein FEA48_11045 [Pseudomonas nitroreducens]
MASNHNQRSIGQQFLGGLQGSFSAGIAQWASMVEGDLDTLFREVVKSLALRLIYSSPVGNPDLWKSNKDAAAYNLEVIRYNNELRQNPANLNKAGRLKRGLKVNDSMEISRPAGYVGGHFRANWQFGIGSAPGGEVDGIDPSGGATASRLVMEITALRAGEDAYLVNNTPYAIPLEYGHSTQAPAGMVRLAAADFGRIVDEQVMALRGGV